MKKNVLMVAIGAMVGVLGVVAVIDKKINNSNDDSVKITSFEQHKVAMEEGADPSIGTTELPEDFIVDGSFESHLPLVVIDVSGKEIPINKEYEYNESEGMEEAIKSENPFVNGTIAVIDNADYQNKLSDTPVTVSDMKIRLRGSSSQKFDKKQYAIKMLDESGNSKKVDVMGIGENNDWILNISMLDQSLMRNYAAMKFGSALFPGTPDCKYCEVFFKDSDNRYEYQGVYLMMEKIEKGEDRVNINTYHPGDKLVSYLLCRDRIDKNAVQLSTYASENKLAYGRLSVLYPDEDVIDDYAFNYIQDDIDSIERVLYSDDVETFETWSQYLDEQSFVDYYIFNSIFRNYDAGDNSTYMYKNAGGKLCMGPVWDYDNACNNDYNAIQVPDYDYFYTQVWFDRLVLSRAYVDALEDRYKELTNGIFSADYINDYLDDVAAFLGNAAQRDWCRWADKYGVNGSYYKSYGIVDSQGFVVDRRSETFLDEVHRFQNYFFLEEEFIMDNLKELEKDTNKMDKRIGAYFAMLFMVLLVCSVTLISRRKMY
ncbi:MAG: CotH kinase family protein [Butyrivibrio sp.]|nr:CotH kinase family protein [Butyrivibrio sp.]